MKQKIFVGCIVNLALMFLNPSFGHASWQIANTNEASAVECSTALFGSAVERAVWKNGKDVVVICADTPILKKSRQFVLRGPFQVVAVLKEKKESVVMAEEHDSRPMKFHFEDESVGMTAYLGLEDFALYEQRISCVDNGCKLSAKSCLLTHNASAERFLSGFDTAISKAGSKSKSAVWRKYFVEGANVKAGDAIVHEAMLGNDKARRAVVIDLDSDSDAEELQNGLVAEIDSARSICNVTR